MTQCRRRWSDLSVHRDGGFLTRCMAAGYPAAPSSTQLRPREVTPTPFEQFRARRRRQVRALNPGNASVRLA